MNEALKRAVMGWAADLDVIANNLTDDAGGPKLEECASILADIACNLRAVVLGDSPAVLLARAIEQENRDTPDPLEWEACGSCGGEHPVGFTGDCRDDANRRP